MTWVRASPLTADSSCSIPIVPAGLVATTSGRRCAKDGSWGTPSNLGPTINSEFNEFSPDPTPDGTHLIFATNRTAALREQKENWKATIRANHSGDYDLWIADRSRCSFVSSVESRRRGSTRLTAGKRRRGGHDRCSGDATCGLIFGRHRRQCGSDLHLRRRNLTCAPRLSFPKRRKSKTSTPPTPKAPVACPRREIFSISLPTGPEDSANSTSIVPASRTGNLDRSKISGPASTPPTMKLTRHWDWVGIGSISLPTGRRRLADTTFSFPIRGRSSRSTPAIRCHTWEPASGSCWCHC